MSVIHVRQIEAHLRRLFQDLIDISDVGSGEQQQNESLLTRSLAAFAIHHLTSADAEAAAKSVTDGTQDNGIDAFYYDEAEKTFYIVQAKWKNEGHGSLSRGETQKYITGCKDLFNARYERFNSKFQARKAEIDRALSAAEARFVLVLIYTGSEPLAVEPERDINDYLSELNDPTDIVSLQVLRQGQIHSIITTSAEGEPINLEVSLQHWGQLSEPFLAYYGQVYASDISEWWNHHHPRLFSPNVRLFLGKTEVNENIIETLKNNPSHFWYFNNGVTVLCNSIRKKPLGGASHETGIFECKDVTIVNGAQTVGAIAQAFASNPKIMDTAKVFVRFISLDSCPDGFERDITRATNTQNRIERRDFVSLDSQQERIKNELKLDGIEYVYKSGERRTADSDGFDLVEATIAAACSRSDISLAVQAKRELGKLWEDIHKPPYIHLFNGGTNSLELWHCVQVLRQIEDYLRQQAARTEGRDRLFAIHGNRVVAHVVFKQLDLSKLGSPDVDMEPILIKASEYSAIALQELCKSVNAKHTDAYLAPFFKNLSKCREIVNDIISRLF